jgi:hypothetical protein
MGLDPVAVHPRDPYPGPSRMQQTTVLDVSSGDANCAVQGHALRMKPRTVIEISTKLQNSPDWLNLTPMILHIWNEFTASSRTNPPLRSCKISTHIPNQQHLLLRIIAENH